MTNLELMKIAKYGIETKIEKQCAFIGENCASSPRVEELKRLLEQYDEIVEMYETAWDEGE